VLRIATTDSLESSWATGLTSASPWCRIGVSVVSDFIPRDVVPLVVIGFFFGGTGAVVVDVFFAGFLATHVRQSLDSFISSGHAQEVVGIVWLILGAGRQRWEQCPLKG